MHALDAGNEHSRNVRKNTVRFVFRSRERIVNIRGILELMVLVSLFGGFRLWHAHAATGSSPYGAVALLVRAARLSI